MKFFLRIIPQGTFKVGKKCRSYGLCDYTLSLDQQVLDQNAQTKFYVFMIWSFEIHNTDA